jgi:rhamnogalacturonan endolyase
MKTAWLADVLRGAALASAIGLLIPGSSAAAEPQGKPNVVVILADDQGLAESLDAYPQTDKTGPWRVYGRGRATTWTIKFDMDHAPKGQAALRVALAGADVNGALAIAVNGQDAGALRPTAANALRYNTNKGVWQELTLKYDAALLKKGRYEIQLTVPAGEVTTGVVYDYLRLELKED